MIPAVVTRAEHERSPPDKTNCHEGTHAARLRAISAQLLTSASRYPFMRTCARAWRAVAGRTRFVTIAQVLAVALFALVAGDSSRAHATSEVVANPAGETLVVTRPLGQRSRPLSAALAGPNEAIGAFQPLSAPNVEFMQGRLAPDGSAVVAWKATDSATEPVARRRAGANLAAPVSRIATRGSWVGRRGAGGIPRMVSIARTNPRDPR